MKRSNSKHSLSGSGSGSARGIGRDENWRAAFWNYVSSRPFIQLLKAIGILISGIILSGACLVWTDYRRPMSGPIKEDVVHKNLPMIDCFAVVNILMITSMAVTVIYIMFDPRRLLILKRLIAIYGICLFLRNLTMTVTSLPDPSPRCHSDKPTKLDMTPKNMFIATVGGLTCGDMIFSGHFMAYILPATIHGHFYGNWLSVILYLNAACGLFLIIASRLHYSIDTFLSLIICGGFSWIYNLIAENENDFCSMPSVVVMYMKNMEWSDGFQALHEDEFNNILEADDVEK